MLATAPMAAISKGLGVPASGMPPNIQPPNIPVGLPWQLPERRSSPWRKKRALPPLKIYFAKAETLCR